jgi:hypothetical protein
MSYCSYLRSDGANSYSVPTALPDEHRMGSAERGGRYSQRVVWERNLRLRRSVLDLDFAETLGNLRSHCRRPCTWWVCLFVADSKQPRERDVYVPKHCFSWEIILKFACFYQVFANNRFIFCAVLALLTLAASWIEAGCPTRLSLLCTVAVCDILYLQYISLYFSERGSICPLIRKHVMLLQWELSEYTACFV